LAPLIDIESGAVEERKIAGGLAAEIEKRMGAKRKEVTLYRWTAVQEE